jgi:hypothetical protein
MPDLTIFTAPKPFTNPHIDIIQRNAIRSWLEMGSQVEVLIIGREDGLAETAADLGVQHLPEVSTNELGTPLVSSIFDLARRNSTSPLLAYINADIVLFPEFLDTALQLKEITEQFLAVGQRWDLALQQPLAFNPGWERALRERVQVNGRLHPASGSDYFLFPRSCFVDMPPFAIGRAGWDNWMIFEARRRHWPVVDATSALMVVHQDHDYGHLPGGQPHYRLPETAANVRLAGGRRALFTLQDASHQLVSGKISPIPARGKKFWREVEIFPLASLRSNALGELAFAMFHPAKAWGEWRGRLAYKLQSLIPSKKS